MRAISLGAKKLMMLLPEVGLGWRWRHCVAYPYYSRSGPIMDSGSEISSSRQSHFMEWRVRNRSVDVSSEMYLILTLCIYYPHLVLPPMVAGY